MFLPEVNWLEHASTKEWCWTALDGPPITQMSSERRSIEDYIEREESRIDDLVETLKSIHDQVQQHQSNIVRKQVLLSPIRRVPSEIMNHIFSFQVLYSDDLWRDRYSTLRVCRHWYRVTMSDPSLWAQLSYHILEGEQNRRNTIRQEILQRTAKLPLHFAYWSEFADVLPNTSAWERCLKPYITRLFSLEVGTSKNSDYYDVSLMFKALQHAPQLHTLSITGFGSSIYYVEDDGTPVESITLESVHTLNVRSSEYITFLSLPNLKKLHIESASVGGDDIGYFAATCPLLQELVVYDAKPAKYNDNHSVRYHDTVFSNLVTIKLGYGSSRTPHIPHFHSCPKLIEVELRVAPDTLQHSTVAIRNLIHKSTSFRLILDDFGLETRFNTKNMRVMERIVGEWLWHAPTLQFEICSHSDHPQSLDVSHLLSPLLVKDPLGRIPAAKLKEIILGRDVYVDISILRKLMSKRGRLRVRNMVDSKVEKVDDFELVLTISRSRWLPEMEKADWELFTELCPVD